jgi:hypothetical protein
LDKSESDKAVDKQDEKPKSAKGGVIINAPGACIVLMTWIFIFGSFPWRKTSLVRNDLSIEVVPLSTCRRFFESPPSSPKVSKLSVEHGSISLSTSEKVVITDNIDDVLENGEVASPCGQAFSLLVAVSLDGVMGNLAQFSGAAKLSWRPADSAQLTYAAVVTSVLDDIRDKVPTTRLTVSPTAVPRLSLGTVSVYRQCQRKSFIFEC